MQDSDVSLRCVKALLITGDEASNLPSPWVHVGWSQIYDLLTDGVRRRSEWTNELVEYLELVERRMTDDEVGDGVRLTRFNGFPFGKSEEFTYASGKRILRLLVAELKSDKDLLKALRLPKNPTSRDAISNQPTLWDFLSSVRDDSAFNTKPHFTVGVGRERAEALLTVPNAAQSVSRRIAKTSQEDFYGAIGAFLKHLKIAGALRNGAVPRILLQQRRYPNMRAIPLTDGRIEFDPRLAFDKYCAGAKPRLHPQHHWLDTAYHLLQDRSGNLQFQIGCVFDYRTCKAVRSREVLRLYRSAWEAGKIFLDTLRIDPQL